MNSWYATTHPRSWSFAISRPWWSRGTSGRRWLGVHEGRSSTRSWPPRTGLRTENRDAHADITTLAIDDVKISTSREVKQDGCRSLMQHLLNRASRELPDA